MINIIMDIDFLLPIVQYILFISRLFLSNPFCLFVSRRSDKHHQKNHMHNCDIVGLYSDECVQPDDIDIMSWVRLYEQLGLSFCAWEEASRKEREERIWSQPHFPFKAVDHLWSWEFYHNLYSVVWRSPLSCLLLLLLGEYPL